MKNGQFNKTENLFKLLAELEPQCWYHGFRPNREINPLLKETGDFLVRHKFTYFVLSFLDDKKTIKHILISIQRPCLYLWTRRKYTEVSYSSIVKFVENCQTTPMVDNVLLKRGVPREHWNIKREQIKFDNEKDLLGSGNFSKVYKAVYTRTKEEPITVAVKVFDEKEQSTVATESRKTILNDMKLMRFCRYLNVAQVFGVVSDVLPTMIVMEYCIGGSLESHLVKCGENIAIGERIVYCYEVAYGLTYLHIKKCKHQNVATRNCLIAADGRIKLSDYGLATLVKNDINKKAMEKNPKEGLPMERSIRWTAPECLTNSMKFSCKTDVWSFGVLMYEIFNNGIAPFTDEKFQEIVQKIQKCRMPSMPRKTPEEICELLSTIWVLEPKKRPRMGDILRELSDILKDMHEREELEDLSPDMFSVNTIPGVTRKYGPC